MFCFFNDTATTEICTLSLHDALPISTPSTARCSPHVRPSCWRSPDEHRPVPLRRGGLTGHLHPPHRARPRHLRSEEHTSELQSRQYLVCRLLLEKNNTVTLPVTVLFS